jgi:glucosamine-phosphate N-acetyltransferase
MSTFQYTTLFQLLSEYKNQLDEIILQYSTLLSQLSEAPPLSTTLFLSHVHEIEKMGHIYICYSKTIENKIYIIGSGTIIYEPKLIRNGKYVGHIEDIVVDKTYRSMGIAKKIINQLLSFAQEKNCYKVILHATVEISTFYEKIGFEKHGLEMSLYF